jgi:predicted SAM-dependent methyltransferase
VATKSKGKVEVHQTNLDIVAKSRSVMPPGAEKTVDDGRVYPTPQDWQKAKNKHFQGVSVGVPTFGMISDNMTISLSTMKMPIFTNLFFHYVRGKPVDVARCEIANQAFTMGAGFVWFRDDDTLAPNDALMKLHKRFPAETRIDPMKGDMVVGGVVYSKTEPPIPMIYKEGATGGCEDWGMNDLYQCDIIGMGCTVIPVGVFQKTLPLLTHYRCVNAPCPDPWGEYPVPKENEPPVCPKCGGMLVPGWFKTVRDKDDDGKDAFQTEDSYFLLKCKKAGIKVYADCGVQCQHEVFNPDPMKTKLYYYHSSLGACWQEGDKVFIYPTEDQTEIHEQMRIEPKPSKNGNKVKFNLGCGEKGIHKKGYVNIDLHTDADFVCDFQEIMPVVKQYGQADEIRASHILEHVDRNKVLPTVRNWLKGLKPGGVMNIEVPDFVWAMEACLEDRKNGNSKKINDLLEAVIFGMQHQEGHYHKCGIDKKRLENVMRACSNQVASYKITTAHPKDYNQQVVRLKVVKKK